MKKFVLTLLLAALTAAVTAPMTFAESVTKTDIIYEDNFDEGTYTVEFNSDKTELYLLKDGVKTWTFATNNGSQINDEFANAILNNISTQKRLITSGMTSGTIEAYYNFPESITTGKVTIECNISLVTNSYYAVCVDRVENVNSGAKNTYYNDGKSDLVSMFKRGTSSGKTYSQLLNVFDSTVSALKKNHNSTTSSKYDLKWSFDIDNQTQSFVPDKTPLENQNWYSNGSDTSGENIYHMSAKKQVSAILLPESNKGDLNIDNIKITHTYEEEEVATPKEEVENFVISTENNLISSSVVFNYLDTDTAVEKEARLVTAVYNADNVLISVKSVNAEVTAEKTCAEVSTEAIDVPADAASVRAYLWNFKTLKPYVPTLEKQLN